MTPQEKAYWLADKIHAFGDYAKEAAALLMRQADEVEALRKDAERYCYLRDHGHLWQFAAERGFLTTEVDDAVDEFMWIAKSKEKYTTQKSQESESTPAELRQAGVAFCPKCYTFGHDHSKSCIYYGKGTAFHKVRSIYEITGRTSK